MSEDTISTHFRNPATGQIRRVTGGLTWLWAGVFGPLYFVQHGSLLPAIGQGVLLALTPNQPVAGIGVVILWLAAGGIVRARYRRDGWTEVQPLMADVVPAAS